jgi:hypothetical protein
MPGINKNISLLNALKQFAPAANRGKIQNIIDMYKDRSIKNIKTAVQTVQLLSSKHKSQQEKAAKTYGKNVSKALNETHRKAKEEVAKIKKIVQTPHTVKTGNHSAAKSHIDFMIDHHEKDTTIASLLNSLRSSMYKELNNALEKNKSIKVAARLTLDVEKEEEEFDGKKMKVKKTVVFRSRNPQRVAKNNINDVLDSQLKEMEGRLENIGNELEGSNWKISRWRAFRFDIFKIKPLRAGSYIPTPARYANSRCGLINIQNDDQECFRWCMRYHQSPKGKHDDRTTALRKYTDAYNYEGITYPATYDDINTFQENNKVCIYVYAEDEKSNIVCDFAGKNEYIQNDCIYLFRVEQEEQSHYIYIKHLERLMNMHKLTCHKRKRFCPMCQKPIVVEPTNDDEIGVDKFKLHLSKCYKFARDSTLIKLPDPGTQMEFKNYKNMLERPYIAYMDFESSNVKTYHEERITRHEPNSVCVHFVCTYDSSKNRLWTYVGEDCVEQLLLELYRANQEFIQDMWHNERMIMTKEDYAKFNQATCCHICKNEFASDDKIVRDHDHRTGAFRGAAHFKCNINYYTNRYLPVVCHNLRGYDSHFIIRKAYEIIERLGNQKIDVIPNSYEKFMSFSIGDLKFIDSLQFMSSSLEKLVENLYDKEDKYKHFHSIKQHYPEHYELLCQKGYYPYEWVDHIDKLDHKGLPPMEAFNNKLTQTKCNEEKYDHVVKVYNTLNCDTFLDYHLAYLKTDVLLLTDVFEHFRKVCLSYYKLDPANYLSAPSLAWDAMLLMTRIKLDLITDLEILDMVERMKRGGLCFVGSKRHVKANHKYLDEFDITKPSNFLMYWDCNNLYGFNMSEFLPTGNLKLIKDKRLDDLEGILAELEATPDDNPTGYAPEVDFIIPAELHEDLRQFPPCPESITPQLEWFSDFQKQIGKLNKVITKNGSYRGSDKLIPHLFEHKNYVLHYRNLKFIRQLGIKITKVHRILSFDQSQWLKPYIDFNTEKRQQAKNEFEKDFFKLMNNSVFGKTMENVKNRMQLYMTTDDETAIKWFSRPTLKGSRSFKGLHMIETYKTEVVYDKPLYVGAMILDLSKLHMMKFHYNTIQKNFKDKHNLIYSDTDSLVYSIEHDDIYEWIKQNPNEFDLTDSKVIGKFKDEMGGLVMKEFIALNPKVYSIITQHEEEKKEIKDKFNPDTGKVGFEVIKHKVYHENYNKKTLKGVSKVVVKNEINNQDYIKVLETNEPEYRKVMGFRSYNHEIYTVLSKKKALTSFYDKMQMIDSINNVPFGYRC